MHKPIYLLTPCLNAATTIDRTIWAIVSQQGHGTIRYHVQDGGSTDGTLRILGEWAERLRGMRELMPMRVDFTYASARDAGMYDGIEAGFRQLDVPDDAFMGWCNADDTLWQGAIACVQEIERRFPDVEWLTGWPAGFDELGRFRSLDHQPFFPRQLLAAGLADGMHWSFVQQESTFWRKRLWAKAGGVNSRLKLAGDWDLWRRFAGHQELVHVDRQLGSFHARPGQKSSDIAGYQGECERLLPTPERHALLGRLLRKDPHWRVNRVYARTTGGLEMRQDVVETTLLDRLKATFRSPEYFLRKLKHRHHAARRHATE